MNKKILLVGTVSNVAKTIEKELKVVLEALSLFDSVQVFLVESDSTDETVKILEKIALKNKSFEYITLEKLKNKYYNRVARIAFCRNIYVKYIRDNNSINEWDYVAVADLDGMNFKLRKKGIQSCFVKNIDWDGVMASQKFGYYDIYALRAKNWVEEDCFDDLRKYIDKRLASTKNEEGMYNFIRNYIISDNARHKFIYSKMKRIKKDDSWISVNSAFGGFAIYKPWVFLDFDYDAMSRGYIVSEHVDFHEKTAVASSRYFINPYMINSNINAYNLNKLRLVRLARFLKQKLSPET
jgi:hypothetical protein